MARKPKSVVEKLGEALSRKSPGDQEWLSDLERKLESQLTKYKIEQGDPLLWMRLALALAEDHVKGFGESKVGRPETRASNAAREARKQLLAYMEHKAPKSVTATCIRLVKIRADLPAYYQQRPNLSVNTLRSEVTLAKKERRQATIYLKLAQAFAASGGTEEED